MIVRCRRCRAALTEDLREASSDVLDDDDGHEHIGAGLFHISDGSFFTGSERKLIVHIGVAARLVRHSDSRRWVGCCGADGGQGPNLLCACGAEVATEKSDCWMPRCVVFEPEAVDLVDSGAP